MKPDRPFSDNMAEAEEGVGAQGGPSTTSQAGEPADVGKRAGPSSVWNRGRFPFKAAGFGFVVLVLAGAVYLRCPSRTQVPDPARTQVNGTTKRIVMQVEPMVPDAPDPETGLQPLELPRGGEEVGGRIIESVVRLEARVDALESEVKLLNGRLDLLGKPALKARDGMDERPDGLSLDAVEERLSSGPGPTASPVPGEETVPVNRPDATLGKGDPASRSEAPSEKPPGGEERVRYHVVAPGDNLYRIGIKYNVSMSRLMEMNGLGKGEVLQPGQKIRIPVP